MMTLVPSPAGRRGAFLLLAVAVACRSPRPERPAGSCTHVQAVGEVRGTALCEDVWTCTRPPGGKLDRIGLHRLAPCEARPGPVVLYLPGMHMNAELPIRDPEHDVRVFLAMSGMRTWGLDYRTHAVPADASEADLATLRGWTPDVFAGDVAWAAGFVRGADPGPLYVAGFSQGAALAYRLAARERDGVTGLVILDGARSSPTPGGSGSPAIDVAGGRLPYADRQRLLTAVTADPGQPSPLDGFATAGEALSETLYTAPSFGGQGGLANTRGGVSDPRDLSKLLQRYDRWWPRAMLGGSAPPDPARPLPVLAFASTRLGPGWVARVRESAQAFGGPQAMVRELPAYGHLDVLVGGSAAREVFTPALRWLQAGGAPAEAHD